MTLKAHAVNDLAIKRRNQMSNFDHQTHKFGMAYKFRDSDLALYLVCPYDSNIRRWKCVDTKTPAIDGWWADTSYLIREPKYDLIPRADVMELVKALEHISADHTGHCPYVAEQALANFNQKYGDVK
jgi:hypothetical protein